MSTDNRDILAPQRVVAKLRVGEDTLAPGPRYWPRWMTVPTLGEYIDRTEQAIRGLVKRGRVPFVISGGRVYFDRLKIDEWMENDWIWRRRKRLGARRRSVDASNG